MELMPVAALGIAVSLDLSIEEPPGRIHPVALFGSLVERVDRDWPHPRLVGVLIATAFPAGSVLATLLVVSGTLAVHPVAGTVVAGLVLFSAISLGMLLTVAQDILQCIDETPNDAREPIRALVGRETADLTADELRSATVESLAENLADGLVAPLIAFAAGVQLPVLLFDTGTELALAVGVAAAVWVKAVNTLDSMLGYPDNPHGWASARLDDVVMWIPARITAVCLALAGGRPLALVRARQWARLPDSPNSGWPMATLAAILDVRLEKRGAYVLSPDATFPSMEAASESVRIAGLAGLLAVGLTGVVVWY